MSNLPKLVDIIAAVPAEHKKVLYLELFPWPQKHENCLRSYLFGYPFIVCYPFKCLSDTDF